MCPSLGGAICCIIQIIVGERERERECVYVDVCVTTVVKGKLVCGEEGTCAGVGETLKVQGKLLYNTNWKCIQGGSKPKGNFLN